MEKIVDDIIENSVKAMVKDLAKRIVIIPSKMRNIQFLSDLSCACLDTPYRKYHGVLNMYEN